MRNIVGRFVAALVMLWCASAWGEAPPACQPLSLAPAALPAAVEGSVYTHTISAYGGNLPVSLTVTGGGLPPGLSMSTDGTVKGAPTASGIFPFSVTATDSCRPGNQSASRTMVLQVLPRGSDPASATASVIIRSPLKVSASVTPTTFALPAPDKSVEAAYELKAQPAVTAVLDSPGGTFAAAGRVIASVPAPLTAVLVNGVATVRETVTVPRKVVEQARADGAQTVIYSRPFTGHGTTALAVIEVSIPPAPAKPGNPTGTTKKR